MSTSRFQFLWPATPPRSDKVTHTLFVHEGPDWCLEELQTGSGAVLRSWSYEILEASIVEGDLFREIVPRSHDWVGSCLLRTLQIPCQIMKEDEKGVWMRIGKWDRVLWSSDDRAAAKRWLLQEAAAAAAANAATAATATATATKHKGPYRHPAAAAAAIPCRIRLPGMT